MLAEPRRKHRIGPNPRGKFFTEDDDNRGRQMLMKMGWKTGDGLGANLHGMAEPIKPKVNTESRGLGFDRKQDPWVAHNEEFEQLLKNLNSNSSDGDNGGGLQGVDGATRENGSSKDELEIKSKGSRSRIHYHKFVKNKDLSRASYKDMSCIFGKSLDVTVQLVPVPTGVVYPGELIQESKLGEGDSQIPMGASENDVNEPTTTTPEESGEESKSKKKKRKKSKQRVESPPPPAEEESIQPDNTVEESENMERKKKKKKNKENKEGAPPSTEEESIQEDNPMVETENMERKKKKKKHKEASPSPVDDESIQPEPDNLKEETENTERKKKKKRKQKDQQEKEIDNDNISNNNNTEELQPESINEEAGILVPEDSNDTNNDIKKKKKKSKKRKRDEEEVEEGQAEIHQNISEPIQGEMEPEPSAESMDSGEPELKKKKKKKSKKARHEEGTDEVDNDTSVINPEANLDDPPLKDAEPNKDPVPQENAEKLGSMQFINRGSLVDYFKNKRLQMLNRASANIPT